MNNQENIRLGFLVKISYFAFVILLSVPVGIYLNGVREYSMAVRVEWVFRPASKNNKSCFHYTPKRFTCSKIIYTGRNVTASIHFLTHFKNNINNRLIRQKITFLRMPEKRLLPSCMYHNENDDDLMDSYLFRNK